MYSRSRPAETMRPEVIDPGSVPQPIEGPKITGSSPVLVSSIGSPVELLPSVCPPEEVIVVAVASHSSVVPEDEAPMDSSEDEYAATRESPPAGVLEKPSLVSPGSSWGPGQPATASTSKQVQRIAGSM